MRIALTLFVVGFCLFCGWLVIESGLFENSSQAGVPFILLQQTTLNETGGATKEDSSPAANAQLQAADFPAPGADHAPASTVILGATDPNTENANTGFKYQLELSSKGAAIRKVTFSNGPDMQGKATGFDDRDYKDPQPLVILSPVGDVLSMANREFIFVEQKLQVTLDKFNWKSFGKEIADDGSQTARFEAFFNVEDMNDTVFKLIKTYKIIPGSYLLECNIAVENLGDVEQKVRFNLAGPGGLGREAFRSDM